jgi:hypothetical protein
LKRLSEETTVAVARKAQQAMTRSVTGSTVPRRSRARRSRTVSFTMPRSTSQRMIPQQVISSRMSHGRRTSTGSFRALSRST